MKNKRNKYRTKGRAAFLAAIMIVSVVALGFAGTATAADQSFGGADWDGQEIWEGQEVEVTGLDTGTQPENDSLTIREVTDRSGGNPASTSRARGVSMTGGEITFDSARLNGEGQYVIRNSSSYYLDSSGNWDPALSNASEAEVIEQNLETEFDEDEVDNSDADNPTDLDVESNRDTETFGVNITAEFDGNALDEGDLADIFNSDGNSGFISYTDEDTISVLAEDGESLDANFSQIEDAGEYEFVFQVNDSTASSSASITVNDPGDAELSVEDVDTAQGDIAEITVGQTAASSGTLVIGDVDEFGYQANVSITDFGDQDEITILFNTYAAGNATANLGDVIKVHSDDFDEGARVDWTDVDNETADIDGILDSGDYELVVSSFTSAGQSGDFHSQFDRTLDEPDDVASLFIEERSTDSINMWTASADAVDDITDEDSDDQVDAINSAIENDLITQTDAVAHGDYAIHQIEADGLEGLFEWAENESADGLEEALVNLTSVDTFENSEGDSALELRIRETRDSVGPNARRGVLNLSALDIGEEELIVRHDDDADNFFIMIDTDAVTVDRGSNTNIDLEVDEDYEFDVKFEVRDERLLVDDPDDDVEDFYQRVDTEFDLVEREGSFDLSDDDLIEVEAESGQAISGETNIAPGSEVRIRIRGQSGATFSKSLSDIVVDTDGTFAGEFDFSDRNVDDEFRATLRDVVSSGEDNPQEDGIVVESLTEAPADDDEEPADDEEEPVDDSEEPVDDEEEPADDEDVDDDTDDETPGFGALVALIALLGAALLAARRQN